MKLLNSPKTSLVCAIINVALAVSALNSGSMGWACLSAFFAVFCYRNYLRAS